MVALALAVPFAGFGPASAIAADKSVIVKNFPEIQKTDTADRPFNLVGSAHIDIDGSIDTVDSLYVPPGMVLVLDAASADIEQSTTVTGVTVQMRLNITIPGEMGVSIATESKPINLQVGTNSYLSNPASWTLPPMHLPPGTLINVSLVQTKTVFAFDYRVLVTGHLVSAAEEE